MAETQYMLVLANSARAKKHCVAGKLAFPLDNGDFFLGRQWIRLADPRDPKDGAVPFVNTICTNMQSVRPLDIIKVALQGPCENPDHPEDWYFDPTSKWEYMAKKSFDDLAAIADRPASVWHHPALQGSVPAGYVRQMGHNAATLYLIKSPVKWSFSFWKEWKDNESKTKRKLNLTYGSHSHEFSVTDSTFIRRHKIFERATESRQKVESTGEESYLCLSLTKLTPEFDRKHYKICATIFER